MLQGMPCTTGGVDGGAIQSRESQYQYITLVWSLLSPSSKHGG